MWRGSHFQRPVFTISCFVLLFFSMSYNPVHAQPFSFAATSDQRNFAGPGAYDNSSYYRGAIEALASVGAGAFMIVPGDLDPIPYTEYTIEAVLGTEYSWYPIIGNHELPGQGTESYVGENIDYLRTINANGNSLPNIVNIGPPGSEETTYSFDYGNCHFAVINEYYDGTSDVGTVGDVVDALYNWLSADLAASTQQHKFVIGHEPAFPQPDADTGRLRHEYDSLNEFPVNRDRFWQLLVDQGVLAYFCGHTHNYSIYNHNGVWQIDSGHARGLGDPEVPSTFVKILVDGDEVSYQTYRDDAAGGAYSLRYTGSLTSMEEVVTIVPTGSVWNYLDDGSNQGTAWSAPGFDDSAWTSGAAQLGYGDGDETTIVGYGPDTNNKFVTTYFRHSFYVPDAGIYTSLNLGLLRDDGAVVYLNGTEIFRSNLAEGDIDYLTWAGYAVGDPEEDQFFSAIVSPSLLVTGTNVLAVELHQVNATSSDISFDLSLTGTTGGTPITSVYGQVYLDLNQNNSRDANEDGLAKIDVFITDSQGTQTVVTNSNGDWSALISPGDVTIDIDQSDPDFPPNATQTQGEDPTLISVSEGNNTFAGADGFYVLISEIVLINAGSVWKYLDDGTDQGTTWKDFSFDDSGWPADTAQFGYGDGDESTVVSFGGDPKKKYITTYFRRSFGVPDASLIITCDLDILRDDGAIVYLNGKEIYRTNMPPDAVDYETLASVEIVGEAENTFMNVSLDPDLLNTGANVLAVEVHQDFKMDEDLSFDLKLTAKQYGQPIAIELINFDATLVENGILQTWLMASEDNIAGFNLYRSIESNGKYEKINTRLIPRMTDGHGKPYEYLDQPPLKTEYYYKLETIALDGTNEFSQPVQASALSDVEITSNKPTAFSLAQNAPNPFNPATTIHYELPRSSRVRLSIYDITGRLVATLVDEYQHAGAYDVKWQASQLSNGLYVYALETDNYTHRRKMILMK